MTQHFAGMNTVNEIKAAYRQLVWIYHPDRGGDTAKMQDLNNQYEQALKACDGQTTQGTDGKAHTYYYNEATERELMEKISELLGLGMKDVDIWLIGTWIWIDGDTRPVKDQLKKVGCKWHSKRKKWYWRKYTGKRRYNTKASFADLAASYGAKRYKGKVEEKAVV